jgi:2-polyprenyl-3-methyl-5-hydroxy-6-metoxy-1,4-benzoquinol methylase
VSNIEELRRLQDIEAKSLYGAGMNAHSVRYSFEVLRRHITPGPILELGPAEGIMTDKLVLLEQPMTVVDGGKGFCDAIKARHPQVDVVNSLFEDFRSPPAFQSIVMGHVLEHVENPVEILALARNWLAPGGRILAAVPNARSLHRQAATIMGLLPHESALNEADRHHGHRRVYNPESFRGDFLEAGLRIEVFGGYWMKPLANSQLESWFSPEMIDAFMVLGERYPDIAGEIYVVARL